MRLSHENKLSTRTSISSKVTHAKHHLCKSKAAEAFGKLCFVYFSQWIAFNFYILEAN